jgi:hypothetical protein
MEARKPDALTVHDEASRLRRVANSLSNHRAAIALNALAHDLDGVAAELDDHAHIRMRRSAHSNDN